MFLHLNQLDENQYCNLSDENEYKNSPMLNSASKQFTKNINLIWRSQESIALENVPITKGHQTEQTLNRRQYPLFHQK